MTEKQIKPDGKAQFIVESEKRKIYNIKRDIYGEWAIFKFDTILICSSIDNKELAGHFCKILNELGEENNSLQKTISRVNTIIHEDREYMEKLDDEIKQLKNDLTHEKRVNKRFNESLLDMEKDCKRFEKENKKLKKQLNEYRQQRDDVYTTSKNPMRFV